MDNGLIRDFPPCSLIVQAVWTMSPPSPDAQSSLRGLTVRAGRTNAFPYLFHDSQALKGC
ncbi:MAG: hypothetical protein IJ907_04250 [Prevotella sp.]|nr:hypothetical protein [Prevotella sp.]